MIAEALARHGKGIVCLSGGKDSIATLHLCRPYAKQLRVVYVDMGDSFPHVLAYVERICREWDFELEIITPEQPIEEFWEQEGLPSDIVPMWSTPLGSALLPPEQRGRTKIQSGLDCCARRLWIPLHSYFKEHGYTLSIRGAKASDEHRGVESSTIYDGVEMINPIWEWDDAKVFEYLQDWRIQLPAQYLLGCVHSLDCMRCTAWLNTEAEIQRIKFTEQFHRAAHAELQARMCAIAKEINTQLKVVAPAINMLYPED